MVDVDQAIIARLKSHGVNFEVLVDCRNAILVREGNVVSPQDLMATQEIFSDAKKGLRVSDDELQQAFA
ncbi:ribosome assembly factor SBDS, partial [Candidatus Woesearchaeota archaeon CG08_land_8_20_14_0_20_43_7]